VRNRANTPSRDEAAFINGGTAGIDNTKVTSERPLAVSKAKPVSISFFEENLKDIDDLITGEMISGKSRVNRSDVVRPVEALKSLSKTEISRLIAEANNDNILLSCYLVMLSCYLVILLSCYLVILLSCYLVQGGNTFYIEATTAR
jgi:chromosome partitioning protein